MDHLKRCKTSNFRCHLHVLGSSGFFTSAIIFNAGGQPREHSWLPNEEGYATTDMEFDQLHVPAFVFFPKWEEAQPKNLQVEFLFSKRVTTEPNHSVLCLHVYEFLPMSSRRNSCLGLHQNLAEKKPR